MSTQFEATPIDLSVSPKEFADLLGITAQGLYKFCREHKIDTKTGNARSHKILPSQARQIAELRGLAYPQLKINVHNVKGGVGKTTTVHMLASRAAMLGMKVLAIDLDQQANLSRSFGAYSTSNDFPVLIDLYKSRQRNESHMTGRDLVVELNEHLHLIPSNLSMANMDMLLTLDNTKNISTFISTLLGDVINDYDFVILDSPPALSNLTACAHAFSDIILLPIDPHEFSVDAITLNFQHFENLVRSHSLEVQPMIFVNKYDSRPKIDFKIISEISQGDFGEYMLEAAVRLTSTIKAEFKPGSTLWQLAKNSPALEDFNSLLMEITELPELWEELAKQAKQTKTSSETTEIETTRDITAN